MDFRFGDYGASDLARCGEAFSRMLQQAGGRPEQLEQLRAQALSWLGATAAAGTLSLAGPVLHKLGAVPQALDLAHMDLADGSLLLAVAHERPNRDPRFGYVYLLARAAALAATRSRAKLLVSSCRAPPARKLLVDCLLELRAQLDDPAPWLWLEATGGGDGPTFTLIQPN